MNNHAYAVIMAGGGGTRLWPLSRHDRPKQLLTLWGEETLFQNTVNRLSGLFPPERILVVTVAEQARLMQSQVPFLPSENYLIEPAPRGTAAVVGLAALVLEQRDPQACMAVLPADHFIRNRDLFHYLLHTAFEVAEQDYLVTLGIAPTHPSTAYGYIQQGQRLDGYFKYPVYQVRRFKEKPDEKLAQEFLRSGDHFWNSGMFVWRAEAILAEIRRQLPALSTVLQEIESAWNTSQGEAVMHARWHDLPTQTIDYGVMEHAERVAVVPASGLGWNDIGSWDTLFDVLVRDASGNVFTVEQYLALETHNTLVYGQDRGRLVVTIGIDDTIIVDAGDVLLVCKADQAQKVRAVVEHLRAQQQERYL